MRCFQCQGQKQKSSQSGYGSHFIFKRTQGLAEFLLAYLLFTHWSAVAYSFSDVETINFTTAKWCCSECFKQRGCPTCLMSQTELLIYIHTSGVLCLTCDMTDVQMFTSRQCLGQMFYKIRYFRIDDLHYLKNCNCYQQNQCYQCSQNKLCQ